MTTSLTTCDLTPVHVTHPMSVACGFPSGMGGGGGLVGGSPGTSGIGGPLAGASPPSTPDLPSPVNTIEATKTALIKEGLKLQIRSKLQAAGVDTPESLLEDTKYFKDEGCSVSPSSLTVSLLQYRIHFSSYICIGFLFSYIRKQVSNMINGHYCTVCIYSLSFELSQVLMCFNSSFQLTEEDEERRRRRRERNKIAATKCRNKKKEKTIVLMSVSNTTPKLLYVL